mmetsp:Transcript_12516/g.24942  ORF Transcript_12516/g.24942 Transcript_12516/m.24942 type:complete len:104 (-) Transcript_12516:3134-3445(-)
MEVDTDKSFFCTDKNAPIIKENGQERGREIEMSISPYVTDKAALGGATSEKESELPPCVLENSLVPRLLKATSTSFELKQLTKVSSMLEELWLPPLVSPPSSS